MKKNAREKKHLLPTKFNYGVVTKFNYGDDFVEVSVRSRDRNHLMDIKVPRSVVQTKQNEICSFLIQNNSQTKKLQLL